MNTSIIDALRSQALERVQLLKQHPAMGDLLKIHSAMNSVEDVEGVPRTSLSELFGLEQSSEATAPVTAIRPGQYLGKNPLEAAKDFLALRKSSATLDEIIDGLKAGSCDPGARDKFGLSLARSTFSFVKLNDNIFDLLDRYPDEKAKRSAPKRGKPIAARVEEIMAAGPTSLNNAIQRAEAEAAGGDEEAAGDNQV